MPPLPPGLTYLQVAAGGECSAAIRSDGSAVAWGLNFWGQTNAPALSPGFTYIQLAVGATDIIALVSGSPLPHVNVIGMGCSGSNGITTLSSAQLPFLGNSAFSLDVSQGAVSSNAYLFWATSTAATPVAVGGGCFVHLDPQSLLYFVNLGQAPLGPMPTNAFGTTSFPLPVPANPSLAGFNVIFQAAVLDATVPLGLTLSNGVNCLLN